MVVSINGILSTYYFYSLMCSKALLSRSCPGNSIDNDDNNKMKQINWNQTKLNWKWTKPNQTNSISFD